MAAENCSLLDPWPHHRPVLFAGDNEALARALRIAVSNSAASSSASEEASAIASPETLSASAPSPSSSAVFNQLAGGRRRGSLLAATRRVAKRKSRASKRTPTTYINADPANFREMVQRVTGVRSSADVGELAACAKPLPLPLPLPPAFEMRAGPDLQQICLPTLDTSAFLLDRPGPPPASGDVVDGSYGPAVAGGPGSEIDAFLSCLPTLDSWGVI